MSTYSPIVLIPGKYTISAEQVLGADLHWVAPRLWRSEFRNVLSTYVRSNLLELADAEASSGLKNTK